MNLALTPQDVAWSRLCPGTPLPTIGQAIPTAILRGQSPEEWQAYRSGLIALGSSDVAKLLELDPYEDARALWHSLKRRQEIAKLDPVQRMRAGAAWWCYTSLGANDFGTLSETSREQAIAWAYGDDDPTTDASWAAIEPCVAEANRFVQRGNALETLVVGEVAKRRGLTHVGAKWPLRTWTCRAGEIRPMELTLVHPECRHLVVHLDAVAREEGGQPVAVEVKVTTPRETWPMVRALRAFAETGDPMGGKAAVEHMEKAEKRILAWWCQVQADLSCTGFKRALLVVLVGADAALDVLIGSPFRQSSLYVLEVPRDEDMCRTVVSSANNFWRRYMLGDEVPPAGYLSGDVVADQATRNPPEGRNVELPQLDALVEEAKVAKTGRKEFEQREGKAKAQLLDAMVRQHVKSALVGGVKLTVVERAGAKPHLRGI